MTVYDETDYGFEWYKNKLQKSKFLNSLPITEQNIVLCCCIKFYIDEEIIPPKRRLDIIESLLRDGMPVKNLSTAMELIIKRGQQFGIDVILTALKSEEVEGNDTNSNK